LALLDRIVEASSKEGDIVLDAFCGCGTTILSAQLLKRKWIGIDMGDTMIVAILQCQPFSKGSVHIQSNDILTTPLVTEAAFEDDRDVKIL
jgi:site-specific DNA-methyltransferase (adenine-specific)